MIIKKLIKPIVPGFVKKIRKSLLDRKKLTEWYKKGCPVPPPHIYKQNVITEYAKKYDCKVLIETGTYLGETLQYQKKNFEELYSVELSEELFYRAKNLFKNNKKIHLFLGDSSEQLEKIISLVSKPALFWLDAHYSGKGTAKGILYTPITKELNIIKKSKFKYIILIDDARNFKGKSDYPTIKELKELAKKTFGDNIKFEVKDDIIRITNIISKLN